MLSLKLFGSGEARFLDNPIDGFPYQLPSLLLCYLLVNRKNYHYRERLAAVFWGDHPTLTARKCLRNALYRLRHIFEAVGAEISLYLDVNEETVSFINTSPYWLDVECFENITSQYLSCEAKDLLPEQAIELHKGIELYTGDLLECVYEDWCLYDRERLRLAYLDALNKLLSYCTSHGDYEQGLDYGERILALDRTRERVHRQMMVLYWLSGDRSSAIAQYKRCDQILQEEMGIHPMGETRVIYEKMVHNQFEPIFISERHIQYSYGENPYILTIKDLDAILRYLDNLQGDINRIAKEIHHVQDFLYQAKSRVTSLRAKWGPVSSEPHFGWGLR